MQQPRRLRNLLTAVAPCWAGEALIATRYLGTRHRTPARDALWVGFQIFKEQTGGGIYGGPGATVVSILRAAAERAAAIELATPGAEISAIVDDLQFALDELRHMTQFIGLYGLLGGDPHCSIDSLGRLPEAESLRALRQASRGTLVGDAAIALSEGGGLGLHFGMQAYFRDQPPHTPVDREIARVTDQILKDEAGHMRHRFAAAASLPDDDSTWDELTTRLTRICKQKLHERNAQFSLPLHSDEIEATVRDQALGQRYVQQHLGFLGLPV